MKGKRIICLLLNYHSPEQCTEVIRNESVNRAKIANSMALVS